MTSFSQPLAASGGSPYIFEEGEVLEDYLISQFFVDPQVGKPAVPVILITELQDRPLVCVPHSVWNRAVSKRVLPSTALTKPAVVEVKGAYLGEPKVELDFYIKVWIGFWKMELVEELHTHVEECDFDYFFHADAEGNVVIPFAQSLLAVAQEHFAFFSAAEEVASGVPEAAQEAPEEEELEPGSPGVESRLNQLEKAVKMMTEGMEKLLAGDAQRPQLRPPAIKNVPKQKVTIGGTTVIGGSASFKDPTSKGKAVPPRKQIETQYPHLDIGVVNASLQAGVPHEQLAEMDAMIASNAKAKKVKDMNPAVRLDPLSEMEWDQALAEEQVPDQNEGDGLEADTSDPIAKALLKLATIVDVLAEDKKKKAQTSKLDMALDSAGGSGGEGPHLGSGKKSAAARRLLRSTFQENPSEIYQVIERLISEDLASQTVAPGMRAPGFNARAWVEFRSKIGAYKAPAHSAWSAAGILDALVSNQVDRARAMACCLLLQLDQSSVDHGSWAFSSELSLEALPPFTSLASHSPPSVQQGEQPFSRILDPRWAEVLISHLRDQDDFLARRKNIGKAQRLKEDTEVPEDGPRRNPRTKPKAKPSAATESSA